MENQNLNDKPDVIPALASAPCSAALVTSSMDGRIEFTILNGGLTIHDADNAWKDWYSLSASQTQELLKWMKRKAKPNKRKEPQ